MTVDVAVDQLANRKLTSGWVRDGSISISRGGASDCDSGDGAASDGESWLKGLAE